MKIYPNNTTTHFFTYLSKEINLDGQWSVALTEIQIPHTFQHFSNKELDRFLTLYTATYEAADTTQGIIVNGIYESRKPTSPDPVQSKVGYVKKGVYKTIDNLLDELNSIEDHKDHIKFEITPGSYIILKQTCQCFLHTISMSNTLRDILGFENSNILVPRDTNLEAERPANLNAALPNILMVYTEILEHSTTGDIETPLLRSVPLSHERYSYNNLVVKNFSPAMYIPLLTTTFRTIEIDIRDQFGTPVAFDFGTLTVTLHFKRNY